MTTLQILGLMLIAFAAGWIVGLFVGEWWAKQSQPDEPDEHSTHFMRDHK